jgi:hypothetical protein
MAKQTWQIIAFHVGIAVMRVRNSGESICLRCTASGRHSLLMNVLSIPGSFWQHNIQPLRTPVVTMHLPPRP